jgi:anti-sigma regulatory factor (Ser/Thr protein kinase)
VTTTAGSVTEARVGLRHEAWPYSGPGEFVDRAAPFVEQGVRAGEAVFVVVDGAKIDALRRAMGTHAQGVVYADMREVGQNPARLIPLWRRFLAGLDANQRARGIGEPVHADRDDDALVECHVHETLVNRALADSPHDLWLACPYDASTLGADVVETARHTHPHVATRSGASEPGAFVRDGDVTSVLRLPLPERPATTIAQPFAGSDLSELRAVASAFAARADLARARVEQFVLGVHEVAANSVRHGPGEGVLSLWRGPDRLVAQIDDGGAITDPMVGRTEPARDAVSGRGLWLANQLFDLVQIRSCPSGTTVRLHSVIR